MAEIRRTVSFRVESAPSTQAGIRGGMEQHSQCLTVPRTAPVKTRPGILRSPSNTTPTNELLQVSGHSLSSIPSTKETPIKSTTAVTSHDTTKNAAQLRLTTSHKMHEEVKCLRYEASKIRETLLKVDEEVCNY